MIQEKKQRFHLFYGWWIVGAAFWIWLITGGFVALGFTAFFEPIAEDFGWSYTQISIAAAFRGVELGLFAPVLGLVIDRWGPRRLAFVGILLAGSGLLLLSRVNSLAMFYMVFLLITISMSFCSPTVFFTATANWFHRKLGIASAIAGSGFALGGLLIPLVVKLIELYQWRDTLIILGIGILILCLPASMLFRHKPEQYGYLPDGDEKINPEAALRVQPAAPETPDVNTRQALKERPFWHIGISMMLQMLAVGTLAVHIMPFLSSIGIPRTTGGFITMVIPVMSIPGRLISGWLADRFNKRIIAIIFFLATTVGMLFASYAAGETLWMLVPFIICYGLGWGSNNTLRSAMLREYFGRSSFGTIFGLMMGLSAIGGIIGPLFAGWIFDNWADYHIAWMILTALAFASAVIIATTPAPKRNSTP